MNTPVEIKCKKSIVINQNIKENYMKKCIQINSFSKTLFLNMSYDTCKNEHVYR